MNKFLQYSLAVTAGLAAGLGIFELTGGIPTEPQKPTVEIEKVNRDDEELLLHIEEAFSHTNDEVLRWHIDYFHRTQDDANERKRVVSGIEDIISNALAHPDTFKYGFQEGDWLYDKLFPYNFSSKQRELTELTQCLNPVLLKQLGKQTIEYYKKAASRYETIDREITTKQYGEKQKNIRETYDYQYVDEHPEALIEEIDDGSGKVSYFKYFSLEDKRRAHRWASDRPTYPEEEEKMRSLHEWFKDALNSTSRIYDQKIAEVTKLTKR